MREREYIPAFPVIGVPGAAEDYPGMSLRDYFAAKIMTAIVSAKLFGRGFSSVTLPNGDVRPMSDSWHAYNYADEMLAERAKGG